MDLDNLIIGKTKERRKIIKVVGEEKSSRIRTRVEQQLALIVD